MFVMVTVNTDRTSYPQRHLCTRHSAQFATRSSLQRLMFTHERATRSTHTHSMAPIRPRSKVEKARHLLSGGAVLREDSDDELGYEDHPWEWIYEDTRDAQPSQNATPRKRKAASTGSSRRIVGARMGGFTCRVVSPPADHWHRLKADRSVGRCSAAEGRRQPGLGGPCVRFLRRRGRGQCEDGQVHVVPIGKGDPQQEHQKNRLPTSMFACLPTFQNTNCVQNELYISPAFDDNELTTINGTAKIVSHEEFKRLYPTGQVKRSSKDFGKIFVCRRGCNTRTTTYTPEFVWEDVYRGAEDLASLSEMVESQTKATRKRGRPRKDRVNLDDFVAPDSDDDGAPKTPRKRRRLIDPTTPTSARKSPAARKFLTPTHKRIVIKKQLEFTPLGTRVLAPSAISSPFQIARNQLHVSSVPAALPCREEEFSTVYSHLEAAITDASGSCIYISGTPGTGKTATVREVVAQLQASVQAEELDDFIFVEINGMKVTDPHQSYSLLWQALHNDRVSPSHALELLEREFSTPSPRRVPCVVLMDELDQLVTKNQSVMYNFFNWPGLRHSRLIVIAVANTMDLPERTLSNKISSRLGKYRQPNPSFTPG